MSNKTNHRRKGTKRVESNKQWKTGILKGSQNTVRTTKAPKFWQNLRNRKERRLETKYIEAETSWIQDMIDGKGV